jgi:uncharacterized protein YceK
MRRAAVLLVAVLLQGCASIYAGELARDALAKCAQASSIEFRGGRWHDSASTSINCRSPAESRYGHADR